MGLYIYEMFQDELIGMYHLIELDNALGVLIDGSNQRFETLEDYYIFNIGRGTIFSLTLLLHSGFHATTQRSHIFLSILGLQV